MKKNNENKVVVREVINVFVETEKELLLKENKLNKNLNLAEYENQDFDKLLKLKLLDGEFYPQVVDKEESVKVVFKSLNREFVSDNSRREKPLWGDLFHM